LNRSGFDLRELPAEEAAASLRRLALWALEWTLRQEEPKAHTTSKTDRKKSKPKAKGKAKGKAKKTSTAPAPSEQRTIAEPTKQDQDLWLQLRKGRKTWNRPPSFWSNLSVASQGRRKRRIRLWAHQQFEKGLRSSDAAMPDTFYDLCATMAWSHPSFELELWELVRRWMFREMIYDTDLERNLGFSSQTLWTLIAIAFSAQSQKRPERPAWQQWILAGVDQWRNRGAKTLAAEFGLISAARLPGSAHWAGFWDQWLLSLALNQAGVRAGKDGEPTGGLLAPSSDPDGAPRKAPSWIRELFNLPFVRFRQGMDPYGSAQSFGMSWSEEAPARLLTFYGYKKAPPPLPRVGAGTATTTTASQSRL